MGNFLKPTKQKMLIALGIIGIEVLIIFLSPDKGFNFFLDVQAWPVLLMVLILSKIDIFHFVPLLIGPLLFFAECLLLPYIIACGMVYWLTPKNSLPAKYKEAL